MDILITAAITLFVIVDPLGTAAVFAGLTQNMDKAEARITAIKATVTAIGILLFFGFIGSAIMGYMGISEPAFKIAGGLLLSYTAFSMVMGGNEAAAPRASYSSQYIAIYPMAIPLMAGPGSITAFLLLLDDAGNQYSSIGLVLISMVAVQCFALVCLLFSSKIKDVLGPGMLGILARIMGIFLAALSVQLVMDGFRSF